MKGFQFYQEKLKKLLNEPMVNECLCGRKPNIKRDTIEIEIERKIKAKPEDVKKILKGFYENRINQKRMIRRAIQDQNHEIEERIQQRSRIRSMINKKSDTFTLDTNISEHEF